LGNNNPRDPLPFRERLVWIAFAVAQSGEASPSNNPSRACKEAVSGDPRSEVD
jgi:hypothetical protein